MINETNISKVCVVVPRVFFSIAVLCFMFVVGSEFGKRKTVEKFESICAKHRVLLLDKGDYSFKFSCDVTYD